MNLRKKGTFEGTTTREIRGNHKRGKDRVPWILRKYTDSHLRVDTGNPCINVMLVTLENRDSPM